MCKFDPVWVQAIASVILIGVTAKYAGYTKNLVEESTNSFIALEEMEIPGVVGCLLKVTNHGSRTCA